MAKEKSNRTGSDAPYYKTEAGIVHSVTNFANGITGTPPAPGLRGGPGSVGSGNLPEAGAKTSANGVVKKFFKDA